MYQFDRKGQYDYDDLIRCARGELFGPGNAQLPLPPMLMFDRITTIQVGGGRYDRVFQSYIGDDGNTCGNRHRGRTYHGSGMFRAGRRAGKNFTEKICCCAADRSWYNCCDAESFCKRISGWIGMGGGKISIFA